MVGRVRTCLLGLLIALAMSAPASAGLQGEAQDAARGIAAPSAVRPVDGQLWEEVQLAQEYWAVRGYDSCKQVVPVFAPAPVPDDYVNDEIRASEAEEWTVRGSCATALVPGFAALTRARTDYFELRYECAVVVHGVGHALGLDHDAAETYPVMAQGFWDEAIPGRCRAWARATVKARRRAKR